MATDLHKVFPLASLRLETKEKVGWAQLAVAMVINAMQSLWQFCKKGHDVVI